MLCHNFCHHGIPHREIIQDYVEKVMASLSFIAKDSEIPMLMPLLF